MKIRDARADAAPAVTPCHTGAGADAAPDSTTASAWDIHAENDQRMLLQRVSTSSSSIPRSRRDLKSHTFIAGNFILYDYQSADQLPANAPGSPAQAPCRSCGHRRRCAAAGRCRCRRRLALHSSGQFTCSGPARATRQR